MSHESTRSTGFPATGLSQATSLLPVLESRLFVVGRLDWLPQAFTCPVTMLCMEEAYRPRGSKIRTVSVSAVKEVLG